MFLNPLILANAALLGVETYAGVVHAWPLPDPRPEPMAAHEDLRAKIAALRRTLGALETTAARSGCDCAEERGRAG